MLKYIFFFHSFIVLFFADIDPCLESNGGCSHNCSLEKGKRSCTCPTGYKLTYDLLTCKGTSASVQALLKE